MERTQSCCRKISAHSTEEVENTSICDDNQSESVRVDDGNSKSAKSECSDKEYELARKLKKIWDENGKKENPTRFADVFNEMAKIYQERSTDKLSLIRSAALYNAALVRSPENSLFVEGLKGLCESILSEAAKYQPNLFSAKPGKFQDLIDLAKQVKTKMEKLRSKVNQELLKMIVTKNNKLHENQLQQDQRNKISNIRNLQKQITSDYIQIMSELSDSCIEIMGEPPCKFALVGMGSLARQEVTPYSDFEHIIVLEELNQQTVDIEIELNYFRWFSVIFQIVLINIQETILPSVVIPSLNNHPDYGNWFYDRITTRGVSFDGMMPHASKFPLADLIKPISEMLKYLTTGTELKKGYHLKDILTKVCYVSGEKLVFEEFSNQKNKRLDEEDDKTVSEEIRKQTNDDLGAVSTRNNLLKMKTNKEFNMKKAFYRSTTLFISALGRLHRIHDDSCFDIIESLFQTKKINNLSKKELLLAVAIACETRLRWYQKCKRQNDVMESQDESQSGIDVLSNLIGKPNVYVYFKSAYALQCGLTNLIGSQFHHFYSNPTMINCILAYCLGDSKKFQFFTEKYLTSTEPNEQKIFDINECLEFLNNNIDEEFLQEQSKITQIKKIEDLTFDKGRSLRKSQKHDEAKEYFKMFMHNLKNSGEINFRKTAVGWHEIGACYLHMNQTKKAIKYLRKSLEIDRQMPSCTENQNNLSGTLYSIGKCLIKMNKKTEALNHFQESIEIKQKLPPIIDNQQSLSVTYHNIGTSIMEINKHETAMEYLQKSLEIKKKLPSCQENQKNLSGTLYSIGECLIKMKKKTEALHYFQESIEIQKKIPPTPDNLQSLSVIYHNISKRFMEINEHETAMEYLRKSHEIKKKLPSCTENQKNLSSTLYSIGECLIKMNKKTEALHHFEESIEIKQKLPPTPDNLQSLSDTYYNIGKRFMEINEHETAMEYLQNSLEIDRQMPSCTENQNNLSGTLYSIGECLIKMKKKTEALNHFQESIEIKQKLPPTIDNLQSLSVTYHNISTSFMEINEHETAMEYLRKSLEIKKKLPSCQENQTNLSGNLYSIGECLIKMNKKTEALHHFQESIEIKQKLPPTPDNLQSLSDTYYNIGKRFMEINEHETANKYLQKSLEIDRQILSCTENQNSLAITFTALENV